jgi:HNH endonuclease
MADETVTALLARRLLASVKVDEATGCWVWQKRAKHSFGYGYIKLSNPRRQEHVHRVSYRLWKGPIPDGLYVLHSCDNPPCINPAHLKLGTHQDNMDDMVARARTRRGSDNPNVANPVRGEKIGQSKLTDDAVRLIRAGMPTKEAMARFGISKATVSKARTGFGWKHIEETAAILPLGGNTKLTFEEVHQIRASGLPVGDLARTFNVSEPTIYRVKRQSWHGQ